MPRNGTELRNKGHRRRTRDIQIGTWNVLSWYRPGIAIRAIKQLQRHKIDITAIQEVRWTGSDTIQMEQSLVLWSGHESKHERGCGFVVCERLRSAILDFTPINDRLCVLRLKGRWFNVTLISVYAPTEEASEEDKDTFYDDLNRAYTGAPGQDVKIVLGDWNAKVGREDYIKSVAGSHSLHAETNENGSRLVDFASSYNMVIKTTQFQRKDIHKATWVSNDGTTRNQIDHVLINGRYSSSIIDARSMRGPDSDSDHFLVKAKLRTRLKTQTTQKQRRVERWDVEKLQEVENRVQYQIDIRNKFQVLEETEGAEIDVEREWQTMKEVIYEAAEQHVGTKRNKAGKKWYEEECEKSLNQKNEKRLKYLSNPTNENREEFNRERAKARKTLRTKKRYHLEAQIKKIEEERNQSRKFYKSIQNCRKGQSLRSPGFIKNNDEQLLTAEKEIIKRWREHFERLLNVHSNDSSGEVEYYSAEPEIDPPTQEEVIAALRSLKNGKSPGSDNIDTELIKQGGETLWARLHRIIKAAWDREIMPKEWGGSIVIPIHKKGAKDQCKNYRGISLLNTAYKVVSTILLKRLTPYAEEIIGDYQCGFRTGRSTVDQVFTIRQLLEKHWEFNRDIHQIFIDFQQAYDSIDRCALWSAMTELGIPKKLVAVTQMCINNSYAQVRVGTQCSETFNIESGLRQGDPLSPLLFNLALEYAMRKVCPALTTDITARGTKIILAFADDVDTIAHSSRDVKDMFSQFENATVPLGLRVNEEKTKYMVVSKNTRQRIRQNITINDQNFEVVKEFKYLGTVITDDNKVERDVAARILAGSRAFYGIQHLYKSKILTRSTKVNLYRTLVRPVVTYGSETWTLNQKEINKLLVWERKILRSIYGPCRDIETREWRRRHNKELEQLYGKENIIRWIKSNRLRWAGHVIRSEDNRLINSVFWERPDGKRSVGRPRKRWKDAVTEDLKRMGIRQWEIGAQDRQYWRGIVNAAKTHEEL